MNLTPWADAELSRDLTRLRQSGEGQALEFKRELPDQIRDLAKEMAAFASSNDGLILLGVADDGAIVGLPGAEDQTVRDEMTRRISGISKLISPPVRPMLVWAVERGCVVLAIRVARGREPLYYVGHRPYLRHFSTSRPAEPAEVVEAVRAHLVPADTASPDSVRAEFLSALARSLVVVRRWGDTDPNISGLKPWLDEWVFDAKGGARTLRDLATESMAIELDVVDRLGQMATLLDTVASFSHGFGRGRDFHAVTVAAAEEASSLMEQYVSPVTIAPSTWNEVREGIGKMARRLGDAWRRAAANPLDGSVEEGQAESGTMGRKLMEMSYYALPFGPTESAATVRAIGHRLLTLEARRLYMDGGSSQQAAAEEGLACAEALTGIFLRLQA